MIIRVLTAVLMILLTKGEELITDKSVECSGSSMDITFKFSSPFTGSLFTEKGFSNSKCKWQGGGRNQVLIQVPLSNVSECGVVANETSGEFSVKLIVSPVETLIVDGFQVIMVRCVYSTQTITLTLPPGPDGQNAINIVGTDPNPGGVVTGSGGAPVLSMQILDGHGIDGPPLAKASVGQRITLQLVLKNTAIYDFYVHSCYAHDGTNTPDASINIIDNNGCGVRLSRAIDVPVLVKEPLNHGPKSVYLHMYGFQFTSSQFVHFECQVKPCVKSCRRQQCKADSSSDNAVPLIPALRKRRDKHATNDSLDTLKLEAVLEIEAQETHQSALVAEKSSDWLTLQNVLFIGILIVMITITTVTVVCLFCVPRRRESLCEDNSYSVSSVLY